MAESGGLRGKGAAHRVYCPRCDRSTAVTWNKKTGDAYVRPHVKSKGRWCVQPGETVTIPNRLVQVH